MLGPQDGALGKYAFYLDIIIIIIIIIPLNVKVSKTVDAFKCNLSRHRNSSYNATGNYWEISFEVLRRIESKSSPGQRDAHIAYLKQNPWVARAKGINLK